MHWESKKKLKRVGVRRVRLKFNVKLKFSSFFFVCAFFQEIWSTWRLPVYRSARSMSTLHAPVLARVRSSLHRWESRVSWQTWKGWHCCWRWYDNSCSSTAVFEVFFIVNYFRKRNSFFREFLLECWETVSKFSINLNASCKEKQLPKMLNTIF